MFPSQQMPGLDLAFPDAPSQAIVMTLQ